MLKCFFAYSYFKIVCVTRYEQCHCTAGMEKENERKHFFFLSLTPGDLNSIGIVKHFALKYNSHDGERVVLVKRREEKERRADRRRRTDREREREREEKDTHNSGTGGYCRAIVNVTQGTGSAERSSSRVETGRRMFSSSLTHTRRWQEEVLADACIDCERREEKRKAKESRGKQSKRDQHLALVTVVVSSFYPATGTGTACCLVK